MTTPKPLAGHRLLVTNDDGIDAPGIQLLEEIARQLSNDVWVIAPDSEKSGAGHSISLHNPIRLRRRSEHSWAVFGTPTDCVLMACYELMRDQRPTIVLSGINNGANLAEDVSYSGTCAAAMEGTLLGIPSIAMSVVRAPTGTARWDAAREILPGLLPKLINSGNWPESSFLNVNFPDVEGPAEVSGVRVTRQGQRPPGAFSIDARVDARNVPYYWVKLSHPDGEKHPDTDLHAIHENAVSVTPIQLDFTNHAWGERLRGTLER
ncbi:MAG: 5'/3'-nucleotidase SurE [Gammaproteobacteria bacterium]|jgi:5'-nucleotidase|nr:5'/3'-nucleotidase SurE [Gammaproteobacteria bacterium]